LPNVTEWRPGRDTGRASSSTAAKARVRLTMPSPVTAAMAEPALETRLAPGAATGNDATHRTAIEENDHG